MSSTESSVIGAMAMVEGFNDENGKILKKDSILQDEANAHLAVQTAIDLFGIKDLS